jgi:uncharacterized membrane protein
MLKVKKNVTAMKNKNIFIAAGFIVVVIALILVIKGGFGTKETNTSSEGNLLIPKNNISETATFYPYNVGGTKMEVLAVKASDGTIRTAFNTCQVCYSSGRGYYKLDGNTLVCQNCGNRFEPDQVEKEKGGCNPVPIFDADKTDDGQNITISKEYLQQARVIFENWRS